MWRRALTVAASSLVAELTRRSASPRGMFTGGALRSTGHPPSNALKNIISVIIIVPSKNHHHMMLTIIIIKIFIVIILMPSKYHHHMILIVIWSPRKHYFVIKETLNPYNKQTNKLLIIMSSNYHHHMMLTIIIIKIIIVVIIMLSKYHHYHIIHFLHLFPSLSCLFLVHNLYRYRLTDYEKEIFFFFFFFLHIIVFGGKIYKNKSPQIFRF